MLEQDQSKLNRRTLLKIAASVGGLALATRLSGEINFSDRSHIETEEERKIREVLKAVEDSDDRVVADTTEANVQMRADVIINALTLLGPELATPFLEKEGRIREKIPNELQMWVEKNVQLHGMATSLVPQAGLVFYDEHGKYFGVLNPSTIKPNSLSQVLELTGWIIDSGSASALYVISTDDP